MKNWTLALIAILAANMHAQPQLDPRLANSPATPTVEAHSVPAIRPGIPALMRLQADQPHISLVSLHRDQGLVRLWRLQEEQLVMSNESAWEPFDFVSVPVPQTSATPGIALLSSNGTLQVAKLEDGTLLPWIATNVPFFADGVELFQEGATWRCVALNRQMQVAFVIDDVFGQPYMYLTSLDELNRQPLTYCEKKYPTSFNGDCSRTPQDTGVQ